MPVHFACPQCRQLLKISRRKIGTICECPRCGNPTAVPAPTTTKRELAHSSSSRLEGVAGGSVSLFDDVNELLAQGPAMPPNAVGSDSADNLRNPARSSAADSRWSQPVERNAAAGALGSASPARLFVQCGLFSVIAVAAFAAGYLFGQHRSATVPAAASTVPEQSAPRAPDWPTPPR
jgi:DNA-directed RNA polymerase subunit M/transcription elongation factor TFIIS